MQIFVTCDHPGSVAWCVGYRWTHTHAFHPNILPKAIGLLVHAVNTKRSGGTEWAIEIRSCALVCKPAGLKRECAYRLKSSFFGYSIHNATTAAPAEDHGVRPLQRLDAVEVVKVPVVLHIVAPTVEEKICRRTVSADDELVSIVFALVNVNPRNVAHDVRDTGHGLVSDQFIGYHSD